MPDLKSTPLKESLIELGGKMVDFAGWEMPVQFIGLRQEHERVREKVGLFDVSHMGEIRVRGPQALETLQWLTTNDVSALVAGKAQYSLLPNEDGGLVDDIIVYCLQPETDYLLCVNASNKDKDLQWILKNNRGAEIIDESDDWGQIAVQGPLSEELMSRVFPEWAAIKPFSFVKMNFSGAECLVARTGYTGEHGYEVFVPVAKAMELWKSLLNRGSDLEVTPVGLGARDTLRTEMCYSLYGHEIDDQSNPFEARLGWVVKGGQKDFIGKAKIMAVREQGCRQKLVGFRITERGIPRQGYKLFSFDNEEIGRVTSGTLSPTLGENIGVGYVDIGYADVGSEFYVQIRQKMLKAVVVETPFVKPKGVK